VLDREKSALIAFRLEQARENLNSSERELNAEAFRISAVRSYYCIFHAMRAVLAIEGFDSKKHSGIIAAFRQRYIKTGIFPPEFSDMIRDAFDARGNSDYADFFIIAKGDVIRQIENARIFLAAAETYLKTL
jgi:uncharacterized protein (UPF0332 family)